MITDKDTLKLLIRFQEVFTTKQELEDAVAKLATKEDLNEVLNGVDRMIKELIAMREEFFGH